MHRLIPEFIQEKYTEHQFSGAFHACALFIDISGFTAIMDTLMHHGSDGAEVLACTVNDIFDPLTQCVFEHGGFVTQFAGDAFTAVFPVDMSSDEAFVRALTAALTIQQIASASSRKQTPFGSFDLSIKTGIAAGDVSWGIIPSIDTKRAAYYFQGPVIDGCANAEKLACPGDIITDAKVRSMLGSLVTFEPEEDHYRVKALLGSLPEARAIVLRPADISITKLFFPEEAIRQTQTPEFRQVISMFVGLPMVGTEEQLRIFMQIVFDLQDKYGGLLNQLGFGDKGANLLFFWGAPIAHENDVARALNFILDLQSQTAMPFHVGISYRIAHAGYSGGVLAGDYTCHGRGNTLAARLMQASPRGEIWVDKSTAEHAKHHFEIDYENEFQFKGFKDEQKVYVVLERKQEEKAFYTGKMVGRDRELSNLSEFMEPIWRHETAGSLLVHGDPGIGKSRLVASFLEGLKEKEGRSYSLFLCQVDELLQESLNPFRYWLQDYFSQGDQQSKARNKRNFNRRLDQLISTIDDETLSGELDRTRSFLGALVNLHWPDSMYEQLDAKGRHENSLAGLIALLLAESICEPVVLVIEDVHWLDEDSMAFLARLEKSLMRTRSHPIAIMMTARPEGKYQHLKNHVSCRDIGIKQVGSDDLVQLVKDRLGSAVSSSVIELLEERVDGNPFFVEQTLLYLQEQGSLVQVDNNWQLNKQGMATLPANISTVLIARLDRLSPDVKELVQAAAVLGREFEIGVLTWMLKDRESIVETVRQAELAGLWSPVSKYRYLFKHVLLRDAAYQMQIRSRRQSLHKLAMEAVETLFTEDPRSHYGEMAHHAEQANLPEKAQKYWLLAAEVAEDAFQNQTAIDYYSQALKLTPDSDLETRFQILNSRELLFRSQGAQKKLELDLRDMDELASLLKDVNKQATVLIRRAWNHCRRGKYSEALEFAVQAVALVDKESDIKLFIDAQTVRLWVLLSQGNFEDTQGHAKALLPMVRKLATSYDGGNLLTILSDISAAKGDYFKAREYQQEHLCMAQRAGNLRNQQRALSNLCPPCMMLGDYDAAREAVDKSLALALECGDLISTSSVYTNKSWVALAQCDWESAIEWAKKGIAISSESGVMYAEAEGLIWLGNAYMGLDQPDRAITAYQKALEMRRESNQEVFAMDALAGLAHVALVRDDITAAGYYLAQIMDYLESGGFLWEPLRIKLTCFRLLELTDDPRMEEFLVSMYRELQKQAEKIPDESVRRQFFENVPWNREIIAAKHKFGPG